MQWSPLKVKMDLLQYPTLMIILAPQKSVLNPISQQRIALEMEILPSDSIFILLMMQIIQMMNLLG